MATSADIAVNSSSYTGNAQLGGSGGEAFKLDLNPLQRLAAFVNLEKKDYWEQQQKNTDKMVDMVAENMKDFDVNQMYGKDREKMIEERAETLNSVMDSLNNQPPSSDVKAYGKWRADATLKISELAAKFETRKKRTATRITAIDAVKKAYPDDAALQASAIKEIDDKFNSTDGVFEVPSLWRPAELPKAAPQIRTIQVFKQGGDDNMESSITVFDNAATDAAVNAEYFGIKSLNEKFPAKTIKDASGNDVPNPKYAEWAKGKSEQEISQAEKVNKGSAAESRRIADATHKAYFDAVSKPEYKKEDGTFDREKFLANEPKLVTDIYLSGEKLNEYNKRMANTGASYTNEGVPYDLPTNFNPEEYRKAIIPDLTKASPTDLLKWDAFSKFGDNAVTTKSTHTGEKSQNDRTNATLANARTIANMKEQGDNYRKELDLKIAGYKKENGKWVKPATSQEADQNKAIAMPAILFGEFVQGVAASMNHAKKDNFSIDVTALSQEAYNALGIYDGKNKDGQVIDADKADTKVTFKRDGTYYITKKDGSTKAGTMTSLQQGFINAVSVPEGFQQKSENAIDLPGKQIWDEVANGASQNSGSEPENQAAATTLNGKINPSTLVKGQSYSVNGKDYIWDGKKLKAK